MAETVMLTCRKCQRQFERRRGRPPYLCVTCKAERSERWSDERRNEHARFMRDWWTKERREKRAADAREEWKTRERGAVEKPDA